MPKANVNINPSHVAQIGYSGFDMGQLAKFSSSVGQLLPVYYDILSPGDKVNFKTIIKSRTQPLNSAAMTHLVEHVEWFFVPIEQLWKPFGNFFYGIQDFQSDYYDDNTIIDYFPFVKFLSVQSALDDYRLQTSLDDAGYNRLLGSLRLLECLGIPTKEYLAGTDNIADYSFTPLLAAAYQKIYMDHYRLDNYYANDPKCYNFDSKVGSSYELSGEDFVNKFLKLRYRPYKKDFFTDVIPSPLIGGDSTSGQKTNQNLLGQVNQWLTGLSSLQTSQPQNNTQLPNGGGTSASDSIPTTVRVRTSSPTASVVSSTLNPANIRTLFATEKLLEITRRAGKHYDKQTLAHFGVKVDSSADGEVIFLGSDSAEIVIGDVVSTAETGEAPLGEIAGKGYAYQDNKNKSFVADRHGVLMAIYSCEPALDYDVTGVDKLNQLINSSDWFKPEYANLGMQPLFGIATGYDPLGINNDSIYGWQYRYKEFKQKYDRVFGNLARSMSFWTTARRSMAVQAASNMLIRPNYLDAIMVVPFNLYTSGLTDEQLAQFDDTDPLLHEFYFDVKKASKMSTYGLPSL